MRLRESRQSQDGFLHPEDDGSFREPYFRSESVETSEAKQKNSERERLKNKGPSGQSRFLNAPICGPFPPLPVFLIALGLGSGRLESSARPLGYSQFNRLSGIVRMRC
jgi:hypothetical protein